VLDRDYRNLVVEVTALAAKLSDPGLRRQCVRLAHAYEALARFHQRVETREKELATALAKAGPASHDIHSV
jgi:hypothetical protein